MKITMFDVRAARERLELTPEALAAELGVPERTVRAWESGVAVPRRARRLVEHRLALAEWSAGMAACELPECGWLEAQRATLRQGVASGHGMRLAHVVKAHMETCEVCAARERWASENLPPLPTPPMDHRVRGLMAAAGAVNRLPPWARPAAWSALATSAYAALHLLFSLPAAIHDPAWALWGLGAVLVAAAAGVAGGLAFSVTRPVTRPLGRPGNLLSGIISAGAYAGAALSILALAGVAVLPEGVPGAVAFALVSVLFGTIVGKMIDDGERVSQLA